MYQGNGWSLAEDHIHYTVGRQCLNGQQMEAAASALAALLKADSKQAPSQQTAYLNEFIHVHQVTYPTQYYLLIYIYLSLKYFVISYLLTPRFLFISNHLSYNSNALHFFFIS